MMKKKLLFVLLSILLFNIPLIFAQDIPQLLLDQKIVEYDSYRPKGDTRIMMNTIEGNVYITAPSVDTVLYDWKLNSKEDVESIAESFIKNSEDKLEISFTDLKLRESIFDNQFGTAWYKQYYNEISVFYGEIGIKLNSYGTIFDVDYRLITDISAPLTPEISKEEVIELLNKKYESDELSFSEGPELYIYENKLVWYANINLPIGKEVFIDSQTGEILLERQNWVSEPPIPNDDVKPIDEDIKSCNVDSDCKIVYQVFDEDECRAGCYNINTKPNLDKCGDTVFESLSGNCICINNICELEDNKTDTIDVDTIIKKPKDISIFKKFWNWLISLFS